MSETGIIAVKEAEKKVVIEIPPHQGCKNNVRVVLDAQTALGVANAIAESAYIADHGVHPNNALKTAVIEDKARKLKTRLAIVLKSIQGRKFEYQAQQVVDVVLSEMT
jgi:hypothetical protein